MLRITIDLIPGGNESRKKTLAVAHVTNTGTGTSRVGDYIFEVMDEYGNRRETVDAITRTQSVFRFLGELLHKVYGEDK